MRYAIFVRRYPSDCSAITNATPKSVSHYFSPWPKLELSMMYWPATKAAANGSRSRPFITYWTSMAKLQMANMRRSLFDSLKMLDRTIVASLTRAFEPEEEGHGEGGFPDCTAALTILVTAAPITIAKMQRRTSLATDARELDT